MKTQKTILTILTFLISLGLSLLIACDQGTPPPTGVYGATKHLVKNATGAAFVNIADVDKDGLNDIILSAWGKKEITTSMKGTVSVLRNNFTGDLGQDNWQEDVIFSKKENVCFPNEVNITDVDGDGDNDAIVPSGFLACLANPLVKSNQYGLVWFEKTNTGSWKRHDIVPYNTKLNGRNLLYFHRAILEDLDDDGIKDLLTVGEIKNGTGDEYAQIYYFKGTNGVDRFDRTPIMLGEGGGSLPHLKDVDQDGDLDIVTAQYFGYQGAIVDGNINTSFAWFERTGKKSDTTFVKHAVNRNDAGPSIQFTPVENLYGDGITRYIGANHTNSLSDPYWPHEAVYIFNAPERNTDFWENRIVTEEIFSKKSPMLGKMGAPGVFDTGDVDGDGDIDIMVSGDGDSRILFLEQIEEGIFATNVIDDGNVGQAGIKVADLTGDGIPEVIVSSYDANAVFVYEIDKK